MHLAGRLGRCPVVWDDFARLPRCQGKSNETRVQGPVQERIEGWLQAGNLTHLCSWPERAVPEMQASQFSRWDRRHGRSRVTEHKGPPNVNRLSIALNLEKNKFSIRRSDLGGRYYDTVNQSSACNACDEELARDQAVIEMPVLSQARKP